MTDAFDYQTGFGNALASEARPGVIPAKQNSPREVAHGLYAEQINGTPFGTHRALNMRTWMYRIRPQVTPVPYTPWDAGEFLGRFDDGPPATPEIMRWAALGKDAGQGKDFVEGMSTFAAAGDPTMRAGLAVHSYTATKSMDRRVFCNVDGDMLIVPFEGTLRIQTELGWLAVAPGEIAIMPSGLRFRVEVDGKVSGLVGELFDGHYQLPERGVVGANGMADERHFKAPVAAFEDRQEETEVIVKHAGSFWSSTLTHSPFDVVGWHGRYAPFKYDLLDFNSLWSVNFDHSDPSILTVLTCPADTHGRNAVDFAVFRGRWDATEHTYRPPFLHRNAVIELNAVVKSVGTKGPYTPGAITFTPFLAPHGVSVRSHEAALLGTDKPHRVPDDSLWIQFESIYQLKLTRFALDHAKRDQGYLAQFDGYPAAQVP